MGIIADRAHHRPRQGFRHLNAPGSVIAYHPGDDRTGVNADVQPQLWMFGPHGF
jgi:hypothetical protein